MGNGRFCQLGYVYQTLNTILHFGKGAKIHHVGDYSLNQLPQFVLVLDQGPRFGQQALQAKAYPLPIVIQAQHIDLHLLAHANRLPGMPDAAPAKL